MSDEYHVTQADCLSEFLEECKKIPSKEVRIAPDHKYSEVISAVEIMDPRTDAMCGYQDIKYFSDLIAAEETYGPEELGALDEHKMLMFMQHMIALEAIWLQGNGNLPQTIFTAPIMHHLALVEKHCPILHIFCLGVLKVILATFETIGDADIKDNEEFLVYNFGLELLQDVAADDVLRLLDEAEQQALELGWTAVAQCFRFHSKFLRANYALMKGYGEIPAAVALLEEAREALEAIEPVEADQAILSKLFHPMTLQWVPALTPIRWLSDIDFSKGRDFFFHLLQSFCEVCSDLPPATASGEHFLTFLLDFSAGAHPLLARSRLLLLIHSLDENIIDGDRMRRMVLRTLDETYGCPLYTHVYDGDADAIRELNVAQIKRVKGIAKYLKKDFDLSVYTPENLRERSTEFFGHLARLHLVIAYITLHNRPRCRRRLANFFNEVKYIQQNAWDIDTNIFGAGNYCSEHSLPPAQANPAVPCLQCVAVSRSAVLSTYLIDIVCRLIIEFNLSGFEVDLYDRAEMPAAYFYNLYITRCMLNNDVTLLQQQPFAPRTKKSASLYPLLMRTRSIALPNESHMFYVEVLKDLSYAGLLLHGVLAKLGILAAPSRHNCANPQNVHDMRYKALSALTQPQYLDYASAAGEVEKIMREDIPVAINAALKKYEHAMLRLRAMAARSPACRVHRCHNLTAIAGVNCVSLRLLSAVSGEASKWTVEMLTGEHSFPRDSRRIRVSFPMYKLKQKGDKK